VLAPTDLLEFTAEQQIMVQFNRIGQQLGCDLRALAARDGNSRALFDRKLAHDVGIRPVRAVQPDDVHDRQCAVAKFGGQPGHSRNRRRGALNGKWCVVGVEVALDVDQDECRRTR
jgi:butyrate kinase